MLDANLLKGSRMKKSVPSSAGASCMNLGTNSEYTYPMDSDFLNVLY